MAEEAEEAEEEARAKHVPSEKYEYAISYDEFAKASEKRCSMRYACVQLAFARASQHRTLYRRARKQPGRR